MNAPFKATFGVGVDDENKEGSEQEVQKHIITFLVSRGAVPSLPKLEIIFLTSGPCSRPHFGKMSMTTLRRKA